MSLNVADTRTESPPAADSDGSHDPAVQIAGNPEAPKEAAHKRQAERFACHKHFVLDRHSPAVALEGRMAVDQGRTADWETIAGWGTIVGWGMTVVVGTTGQADRSSLAVRSHLLLVEADRSRRLGRGKQETYCHLLGRRIGEIGWASSVGWRSQLLEHEESSLQKCRVEDGLCPTRGH